MFNKLQIRGFSTNKKLDLAFGPGVTSIVGKSFKGKTAAIQALKWLCRNTPAGEEFINWDSKKAAVKLALDDTGIIRSKGKGGNLYLLKGRKKPFRAFGNNVPDIIKEVLNISDLNFQGQHDSPFWFGETAGEVSRQLNTIVNLEVIDSTLSNIDSKKKKAQERIRLTEERLKEAVEDRKGLEYIVNMDKDLTVLEGMETGIQLNSHKCSQIDELIKTGQIHASTRDNASVGLELAQSALSAYDNYRVTANSVKILSQLIKDARRLLRIIKADLPSIKPVREGLKKVAEIDDEIFELKILIQEAETKKELVCQNKKTVNLMESQLAKYDACPLCKREFG